MGFWSTITYELTGMEDPITNGRWNTESPWCVVRVQLLKLSLVVNWDGTQVGVNAWGVQHAKHFRGAGKYYL